MSADLNTYLEELRACRICAGQMQRFPNPIVRAAPGARILIASQAPGNLADRSSKPFADPSGVRLRDWMGVSEDEFYDESRIVIGGYAQKWHLGQAASKTLTETVRNWRTHLEAGILPTPHPSWRNNAWLKKNPWFETDILPVLRRKVRDLL